VPPPAPPRPRGFPEPGASAQGGGLATAAGGAAQGFFVPYLTGGISIAVLAVGSTAPGLLEFAIGKFSSLFPVRALPRTYAARCSVRQVHSQSSRCTLSPAGALSVQQVHSAGCTGLQQPWMERAFVTRGSHARRTIASAC